MAISNELGFPFSKLLIPNRTCALVRLCLCLPFVARKPDDPPVFPLKTRLLGIKVVIVSHAVRQAAGWSADRTQLGRHYRLSTLVFDHILLTWII